LYIQHTSEVMKRCFVCTEDLNIKIIFHQVVVVVVVFVVVVIIVIVITKWIS